MSAGKRNRRASRLALAVVVALVGLLVAFPGAAAAQQDALVPQSYAAPSPTKPPPGFALSARDAWRIADRVPEVREERREHPGLQAVVAIPGYAGDTRRFAVTYADSEDTRAEVHVSGLTGEVLEVWTGPQADTPLARGQEPSLGRSVNKPYVWLPLAALFLLPFFDPRRLLRVLHLDLLVLLGFGLSHLYFNQGRIDVSVPLVYPLLGYLLVRLALAGFRPRGQRERLVPFVPVRWLAVGLIALIAFRIGMNVLDSHVIDVGYASVIGADRIAHGQELYVFNAIHGDTYGPLNYLAYVPFELVFPSDGTWGNVPAAHAAAIFFDLLTIVGLFLLGRQMRRGAAGMQLGLVLAFAWAAYPYTLFALNANTNDGLIAAVLVYALLALRSPAGRGLLLGLGAAAKFAPAALAPLFATGLGGDGKVRAWTRFGMAFATTAVVAVVLFLPDGGVREFYDTTLGFQLGRESPFSLWGLHPSLAWLQDILKLAAVCLALAVAFVPARRDTRQVAALGGAVLVAIQIPAVYWLYFYLVWIAPFALVTMFGAYGLPATAAVCDQAVEERELERDLVAA